MFERFTERARQVIILAQEESRTLKHNYIGTEHVLLGLLRVEEGLAARVLDSLDVTIGGAREQVVRIVGLGEEMPAGQIPFTPRAKKVLELALREAVSLGHNYIGTEHILLGLAREDGGVATRVLLDFNADSEKVRNEVMRVLSEGPARRSDPLNAGELAPDVAFKIGFAEPVRELLRAAAARALQDKRAEIELNDLLLALTADELAGGALTKLLIEESTEGEAPKEG
ncbi:MAG TPA: Clp protease N-terminal domain-containing protein [Solirubrobacteraceae bacterium]